MAKSRTIYICSACGAESPQWLGKCPSCDTYGTLEEQVVAGGNNPAVNRPGWQNSRPNNGKGQRNPQPRISVRFSEITQYEQERFPSGYGEFNVFPPVTGNSIAFSVVALSPVLLY